MSTPPDLQPEVDVVLQEEHYDDAAVKVCVESVKSPVRTQELPHKAGATRTRTVGTAPVKLLAADHFRARATIVSIGQNMLFAFSNAATQDPSTMALWPAGVPYISLAATEVWVASATSTTSVSYASENWAAGD